MARAAANRDIIAPSRARRRHGVVERAEATVQDANGGVGLPFRALSATEIMLRRGTISREMALAGDRFHVQFVRAGLDPIWTADPTRVPVLSQSRRLTGAEHSEASHREVIHALQSLGGVNSILGSCAWHCIGRQISLRTWSIERGWNHRPVNFSAGVLVSCLELLRFHYDRSRHARGA